MSATGLNHVSLPAADLEGSTRFDDFEGVYRVVRERGLLDDTFGHHCYELPDGSVQLYFRDPSGNLVEIDWPDVTTLDRSVVDDVRLLDDDVPQPPGVDASLFLGR